MATVIVNVKKLEFVFSDSGQGAIATTSFGNYEIFLGRNSWGADFVFGNNTRTINRKLGVTKDDAMSLCQTDFDTCVKQCLEDVE